MKKMFLMALLVALMAGLSTTTAFAQRGAGAKLRGDFGHGFWSRDAAPAYRSTMTFQATPMVDANRSFSYEPTVPADNVQPAVPSTEVKPTVRCTDNADVTRRYSYEPGQSNAGVTRRYSYEPVPMVPSYSYRSVESSRPSYMYPKTDPRRFQH
ncbi:hypothetical protein LOC68_00680 [Blastopirellula sp. JC732]|uniref:Uncharacterized protein n=1 Tax=Blastopirellula sediminis TaxID=2894196 RepID=A0A9X1SH53_9BACT|nr:hypothetical protein [Blastopirellula sediminis]MCC9604389.1 hypothetical protein [Blastopirellula sediminis]MCC9626909.1 hypothetical protein [Blastopirellula sediminis]